ncbi:MAG: hypothetical protein ACE5G2_07015 [Candidatus Krumholzibacteriia bacterium]
MRILPAGLALAVVVTGCGKPRLALDPIPIQDDDRYDIPQPKERLRDDYYDVLDYTIYTQIEQILDAPRNLRKLAGKPKQALNVTPLDEIQDSTWFENHIGIRDITPEEMRQGPNDPDGPDIRGPWIIVRAKTQGVTPGFTIEGPRGARYVIKFDPAAFPELATGAEAISTRFLWAIGYHVPQNYIVHFDPGILEIGPKAKVRRGRKKRSMTRQDLDRVLAKVPRNADGTLRAIASRFISGTPLGPPPWAGRRKDDPNDVIPHEHRRELRAYRVFCSWLHHNDSREINAADFYVEEEGRHFVKHYLIDFGATLGSRSYEENLRSEGFEYVIDFGEMTRSIATAGLYERPWTRMEYPEIRGVGRFEAEHFDPGSWKPDYPNPAFENITARDGFWGAKIVMRFDDELIRKAVEAAEFTDPRATDYVTEILIERRDRVVRYWFQKVNPLDGFEAATTPRGPVLRFEDLAVNHGLVEPRRYRVAIQSPDNGLVLFETSQREIPLGNAVQALGSAQPRELEKRLVRVFIRSSLPASDQWTHEVKVTVYVEPSGRLRIAAIERDG